MSEKPKPDKPEAIVQNYFGTEVKGLASATGNMRYLHELTDESHKDFVYLGDGPIAGSDDWEIFSGVDRTSSSDAVERRLRRFLPMTPWSETSFWELALYTSKSHPVQDERTLPLRSIFALAFANASWAVRATLERAKARLRARWRQSWIGAADRRS